MNREQKSEAEQVEFFEKCYERFRIALDYSGEVNFFYRIGGTTVRLIFAGNELISHLTPALEHLGVSQVDNPDATFCIWDSDSTSVEMVPPPCSRESFTDRGDIWGFNSERIRTAFHWIECSVNLLDRNTNTGIYWVQKSINLPYWVHASPLRTLFHWWMENNGCQLLHAAGFGTDDGALLLTGKGGVGKSTTALSCLQSGLYYIADDYLIVRPVPEPVVYTLYCTAKLNADHVANFPALSRLVTNKSRLDREKAVICLYPEFKNQILAEMPLKAILTPQISNKENTCIKPAPSWKIQRAASFTTMSQLPYVNSHTHDFICRLSSTLPGYDLELGRNLEDIPRTITDFLKNSNSNIVRHRVHYPGDEADSESKPLISVIIPVFKGEDFIRDAVENVLNQNYPALELIIVNDGSTDNSEEVILELSYDIRYFKQDNSGPAAARNRGIRDASGEIIAFLDVDDLWPDNNLNLLIEEFLKDHEAEVIHGYAQVMEKNPESNRYEFVGNPKESFRYYIGAGIYRKSVFAKVGLFDNTMLFGEDHDWYNRAKELNIKIKRIEDLTLLVRRHGGNMTHGKDVVELNTLRIFKKVLDRRRAQEANQKNSR